MKANKVNEAGAQRRPGKRIGRSCLRSCQKIHAGVSRAKASLLAEARDTAKAQERLLRLAMNEAEALAWQTGYPHLLFPALAQEKIEAVADWTRRQEAIRQPEPSWSLVA